MRNGGLGERGRLTPSVGGAAAGGDLLPHPLQYLGEAALLHDSIEARAVVGHHARAFGHDVDDALARSLAPHDVVDAHRLLARIFRALGHGAHDLAVFTLFGALVRHVVAERL